MTDQELLGLARQGLNMAATEREQKGQMGILLANYYANEGVHRMHKVEQLLVNLLGRDWLDHGGKKDFATAVLKRAMAMSPQPPDAVITTVATNMFTPTAKFRALPARERRKLMRVGHDEHHRMTAEGLLELHDGYTAIAQTPERVCFCTQEVGESGLLGKPVAQYFDQQDFGGRFKLYGGCTPEEEEILAKAKRSA